MINQPLDFEKNIAELEKKIEELKQLYKSGNVDIADEIARLEKKVNKMLTDVYSKLTPWQKTQIARHPQRPYFLDYVNLIFSNFIELHGDRMYGDDPAICGGFATFRERTVMLVGQQKGRTAKEKSFRNFGMPHPEGYRKAIRLFKLAERFKKPVITFIDTPGAFPGIGAEERNQAGAIASSIATMLDLRVPIISIVIGEGGSGGALAIGVCDRLLMLQYSIYSVISPEGCASILWRDTGRASEAAEYLKLTADDLLRMGIADEIVNEPLGGAHRNWNATASSINEHLYRNLVEIESIPIEELKKIRYEKYRKIGVYKENNLIFKAF